MNENPENSLRVGQIVKDSVVDIDGNIYHSIRIGTQIWMVENLKVTHYQNGDLIPNVTDSKHWSNLNTGACCDYNNDSLNSIVYGKLYNWFTIKDSRKIAPKGWHVPTDSEWNILEIFLDDVIDTTLTGSHGSDIGCKLKESGTSHWLQYKLESSKSSGFKALPGSCRRGTTGDFGRSNEYGHWWTSTEHPESGAWCRDLYYKSCEIGRGNGLLEMGCSIRCIKDK